MGIYSTLVRPGIIATVASIKPTVLSAIERAKLNIETPIKLNRLKKKFQKRKDPEMRKQILDSMKLLQESSASSIERTKTSSEALKGSLESTLSQAASDADVYQKEVVGHIANLALKEVELLVTYPPMIVSVFANPFTINTGPAILLSFKEAIDNAKQEANDLRRSFTLLQEKVRTITGIIESIPDAQSLEDLIESEFAELDKLENEARLEVQRTLTTVDGVKVAVDAGEISSKVVDHFAGYVPGLRGTKVTDIATTWSEEKLDGIEEEANAILESFDEKLESIADLDEFLGSLDELRDRKSEFLSWLSDVPDIKGTILLPLQKEIEAQEKAVDIATAFFVELDDVFSKTQKKASDKQSKVYEKEYKKFRKKGGELDDDDKQRYESAVSWGRKNGHSKWGTALDNEDGTYNTSIDKDRILPLDYKFDE